MAMNVAGEPIAAVTRRDDSTNGPTVCVISYALGGLLHMQLTHSGSIGVRSAMKFRPLSVALDLAQAVLYAAPIP